MKNTLITRYLIITLAITCVYGKKEEIYKEECAVWNNVTALVENEPRLNVTCRTNADCTGFDCNGEYSYKSTILTGGDWIYRKTCFGIDLHPCSGTPDMTVYIDIDYYKSSFLKNVTGDEKDTLRDVEEKPAPFTTVKVELNIEFEVIQRHNKNYAKIHMILQPVVHTPLGTNRPQGAKVVMVPDVEVPIPRCDPKVKEILHQKGVCPDLSETGGQGFKPAVRVMVPGSEGCALNSLSSPCGERQACLQLNESGATACHCLQCHYYSDMQKACIADRSLCQSGNGTIIIDDGVMYFEPSTGAKEKANVVAIACGVTGVFVAAILVLLVAFAYRRYRARYASASGDRAAVLGNQATEDDDDDPIAL